jgi:hypothetical protein
VNHVTVCELCKSLQSRFVLINVELFHLRLESFCELSMSSVMIVYFLALWCVDELLPFCMLVYSHRTYHFGKRQAIKGPPYPIPSLSG